MMTTIAKRRSNLEDQAQLRESIIQQVHAMHDHLYKFAMARLQNADLAKQVIRKGMANLRYKENLENIQLILRPWLELYIDYLCRLETRVSIRRMQSSQTYHNCRRKKMDNKLLPMRVVHLAKQQLSVRTKPPSMVA